MIKRHPVHPSRQASARFVDMGNGVKPRQAFIAKVERVFSDQMTCDLITEDGQVLYRVPVRTKAGVIDGKPYGEIDLPQPGTHVIVEWVGHSHREKVISGTYIPALAPEWSETPVNSDNKSHTLTMLEADNEKGYKRVFPSGTSVEVKADGTIVIETPSGAAILVDENAGTITLSDQHSNSVLMDSSGITLTDTNSNTVSMESGKTVINGNLEVLQ